MKKIQTLFFVVLVMAASSFVAHGQGIVTSNQGTPFTSQVYAEVNGSPYLSSRWVTGNVALKDGQIYKSVEIKYDQVGDQLLFKADNGDSLLFAQPVHEFELPVTEKGKTTTRNYRNGFPAVNGNTTNNFYEVINDGKVKILKRTKKNIQSHKDYSSANVINDINTNTTYYVLKDNTMTLIKPGSKTILEALSDKSAEVAKYIKDNNLDARQDADLGKIFTYYNSL
ncbi:hypothetical protein [Mucilaginibacter jinjuensis]|uniref:Uncharacterized protein n=1 Tax=Mucilaginibacter jinjuensis TaxID=1176721 RepID=A0ABY7T7Q0_9SPHI|nr:hypothetical protein [Mucilaginibacter jinjuensis]WCT12436.1 hypothetical protein PQO05_00635 [Mucilaginibacter jinjuensis]